MNWKRAGLIGAAIVLPGGAALAALGLRRRKTICATDWIQTYSGLRFNPLNPRIEDVKPIDIVTALGRAPRFAGHLAIAYPVASHAVMVSYEIEPELALYGLHHNDTEAYLVDVPRPVKRQLPEYMEAEKRLSAMIYEALGLEELDRYEQEELDRADNAVLRWEAENLFVAGPTDHWSDRLPQMKRYVPDATWTMERTPAQATSMFVARWRELQGSVQL
ncbi:MAG: hypothetical protein V2A73_13790 [Pseudomonadota bacterium]